MIFHPREDPSGTCWPFFFGARPHNSHFYKDWLRGPTSKLILHREPQQSSLLLRIPEIQRRFWDVPQWIGSKCPPRNEQLSVRTWKWMLGILRLVSFWGYIAYLQGRWLLVSSCYLLFFSCWYFPSLQILFCRFCKNMGRFFQGLPVSSDRIRWPLIIWVLFLWYPFLQKDSWLSIPKLIGNRILKGGEMITLIFPKVPQSFFGNP